MRILSKVFWMAMLLILLPMAGQAQEALLGNLYSQVFELYDQGRYSEAADIAKEALKVAENTFGEDHPNVAISLNNLAYLYDCQGNHAQSGPLYRRALDFGGHKAHKFKTSYVYHICNPATSVVR